jgi:hypothetical protein
MLGLLYTVDGDINNEVIFELTNDAIKRINKMGVDLLYIAVRDPTRGWDYMGIHELHYLVWLPKNGIMFVIEDSTYE